MKGIKKQHRSERSPQIYSQGLLSDLPRLHVADESNMAVEKAKLEICHYPRNARSKLWEYFVFYQVKEGPKTKENLDMTKVICRLCTKQYTNKGLCLFNSYKFKFVHRRKYNQPAVSFRSSAPKGHRL